MNKIEKWSRAISVLFQIILVGIPIWAFLQWVVSDAGAIGILDGLRHKHAGLPQVTHIGYETRWICFGIVMIQNAIAMYGFYHLVKLFKLFQKGQIFVYESINELKISINTICVWCIANVFTNTLLVLALTYKNPEGQRILSVSFDATNFSALVIGIIATLIVHIMDEGRKLKEVYDYTI